MKKTYHSRQLEGILCVDKPQDWTSFDVVAKMRGIADCHKIGHGGTLDPMATGVLPLFFGRSAKAMELMPVQDKRYTASIRFGVTTDTQDCTGNILSTSEKPVTKKALEAALAPLRGTIDQLPPMYSAVWVDGQRLYKLARAGKEVERPTRQVTIHRLDLLEFDPENRTCVIDVACSKGTYIRTLCHDIGAALGCGGCMESLLRTQVSEVLLKDALKIGEIGQLVQECANELPPEAWSRACFPFVRSVDSVFLQYQKAVVPEQFAKVLYNGNRIEPEMIRSFEESMQQKPIRIYDEKDHFIGIYEFQQERGNFKPVKVFMEE